MVKSSEERATGQCVCVHFNYICSKSAHRANANMDTHTTHLCFRSPYYLILLCTASTELMLTWTEAGSSHPPHKLCDYENRQAATTITSCANCDVRDEGDGRLWRAFDECGVLRRTAVQHIGRQPTSALIGTCRSVRSHSGGRQGVPY